MSKPIIVRSMIMNKNIKRLQVKATNWYIVDYLPNHPDCKKSMNDMIAEKFAQLIVRECSNIYECIDHGNDWVGTTDYPEAIYKTFNGK